jgi:hypothetical protein
MLGRDQIYRKTWAAKSPTLQKMTLGHLSVVRMTTQCAHNDVSNRAALHLDFLLSIAGHRPKAKAHKKSMFNKGTIATSVHHRLYPARRKMFATGIAKRTNAIEAMTTKSQYICDAANACPDHTCSKLVTMRAFSRSRNREFP